MTPQPINGLFPVLIQPRVGTQGNFELVATYHAAGMPSGALAHYWRDNDAAPDYPWSLPTLFGANVGPPALLSPTMIESNFGAPGNLEVIQSRFGTRGNFEVVSPVFGGGLAHWWRNNDDPNLPWSGPTLFGATLGQGIEGITVIQSNFGDPGNLEVICSVASGGASPNRLHHLWRDSGPTLTWHGPYKLPITPPGGVIGPPVLIQGRFGVQGNFELVAIAKDGGLAHFSRDNDDPDLPWSEPTLFGGGLGPISWVTMIQSNFGD